MKFFGFFVVKFWIIILINFLIFLFKIFDFFVEYIIFLINMMMKTCG